MWETLSARIFTLEYHGARVDLAKGVATRPLWVAPGLQEVPRTEGAAQPEEGYRIRLMSSTPFYYTLNRLGLTVSAR